MKTRLLRACGRWTLLLGAVAMLASCDGGIFGTGDGAIDASADTVGEELPDPQAPTGTDTSIDGGDGPSSTDDPDDATQGGFRSFENLETGSSNTLPLIALANFSAIPLNLASNAEPLFMDAIPPGFISGYASIALETTQLSVFDAATQDPQLRLSPLNLGAFSVSTLIARDRLTNDTSEQNNPVVDIIAIASRQLASEDGVARVRLLQASAFDENDEPASMSLVPADESPGGSEVDLGIVSAADFGTTSDYRLATPGTYRLVDSLQRLPPQMVELAGGEFHTLILTGSPVQLVLLNDSQPADQGRFAAKSERK